MQDTSGSFSDGGGNYPSNSACQFRIISSVPIVLTFGSLSVERNYDFIRVYDGESDQSPLLSAVTGTVAEPIRSSGSLFVVFTSDSSVQSSGFVASYTPLASFLASPRKSFGSLQDTHRPAAVRTEAEAPMWSVVATVAVVALAVVSMVLFAALRAYKNREGKKNASGIRTVIGHSRPAQTAQFVASFQRPDWLSEGGIARSEGETDLQRDPYKRYNKGSMVWT